MFLILTRWASGIADWFEIAFLVKKLEEESNFKIAAIIFRNVFSGED